MDRVKAAGFLQYVLLCGLHGLTAGAALANGAVVAVTPDALEQAVALAAPGTTLVLAGGDYGVLALTGTGGSAAHPLTLRSADPAYPARFSQMQLNEAHDLVLEGLVFDYRFSPGDASHFRPFEIIRSRDVTIRDALFDGDVARGVSAADDGYGYAFALGVQMSEGVTIERSEARGFMRGFVFSESRAVTLRRNDLHGMRSDGMDFVQVQDVLIEDNLIRDFASSPLSGDHPDMIQFWTTGATAPNTDIMIRNNVLSAGAGWYSQSIFMRNELVDQGVAGAEMLYRNVTIEGNVIINAHLHGITVGETAGLTIANNTLIRGRGVQGTEDPSGPWTPRINVAAGSSDVRILRNVVPAIAEYQLRPDWVVTDNFLIQDQRTSLPGFYDAVFVAARTGNQSALASFRPVPGGPLDDTGLGAPRLNTLQTPAVLTPLVRVFPDLAALNRFTFDASLSAGPEGRPGPDTSYSWEFGDGQSAEGQSAEGQSAEGLVVSHIFAAAGRHDIRLRVRQADGQTAIATAGIIVPSVNVLSFDARAGRFISWVDGEPQPVPGIAAAAGPLQLGDPEALSIPPQAIAAFFEAGDFDLRLRLRATGNSPAGEILRVHPGLVVQITPHGTLEAWLDTGTGQPLRLSSGPLPLFSGGWHDIGLTYSSGAGRLVMVVDGGVAARGRISGPTRPLEYWGMSIGYPFKDKGGQPFTGELDSLELRANVERFLPPG